MIAKDAGLDEQNDLIIGKDFIIVESDETHIEHIIAAAQGNYFEHILLGVGIVTEINGSTSTQELKQKIRRNLALDNFSVKSVEITQEGAININAKRIM
jgi:hypothetical protein